MHNIYKTGMAIVLAVSLLGLYFSYRKEKKIDENAIFAILITSFLWPIFVLWFIFCWWWLGGSGNGSNEPRA